MPYSTGELSRMMRRHAMAETRGSAQELPRVDYHIAVRCSKCNRNVNLVQAARCADVCCPKLFGALRAMEINERGGYSGRCTHCEGAVSGRDERCQRCGKPKPFLYEYELKEERKRG